MGTTGWTWLLVLATFALYLAVAVLWKVRSGASYYVVGRRTSPALEGMAHGVRFTGPTASHTTGSPCSITTTPQCV